MVYEARPGQTFLLGASSWRIEEIGRDRVIVTPAPGAPGAVPFWKGDSVGRPRELGRAIGAFSRWAVDQDADTLERDYDLDPRAARNVLAYLQEQQQATRVVPSDRTIVVERFRDEIGDWRLCVLSPFGGRVHAAWGLALSARIRDRYGLEADAIWSDDGIIVHLPDADDPPGAELVLLEPDEIEDAVVAELAGSALFGARFRENAARSLLIPRAYPGRRTPLWQQRLKAQTLLEVARRYGDFPVILETYRECLRDVLDLPGLKELLGGLHSRELSLVEVETATASPFASSLLFDYVATYMYEGDAPNAERRAAALSLDRDLLRELLGQEELRELIDPGALEQVEDDLQHRSERTRAATRDALADILRRIGDLDDGEASERVLGGLDAGAMLAELERERRAVPIRIGGRPRWIAADDAGLYRDALGAVVPAGLPEVFLADVEDPLRKIAARWARTHGPFTSRELHARYGVDFGPVLAELERAGAVVRGELRPGGSGREWCDPDVLRRLRRASLAALRREIEPVDRRALASFLTSWQGVDRHGPGGAGIDRLREVLVSLQGLALGVEVWERDVLPRRSGASGELVWVGAGSLGRRSGRVALYFRDDAPLLGPPAERANPPSEPEHDRLRERLGSSPCFFTDLLAELELPGEALQEALWDLVWAGEVTNDAWAPLRAPRLTLARASDRDRRDRRDGRARPGRRFSPAARGAGRLAQPQVQGRWSLTRGLFEPGAEALDPRQRRRTLAELLLERYGIVTREQVRAEGVPGGFAGLYQALSELETLGTCRRGYFVEGLGGAQFALPGAVERLRAQGDGSEAPALMLAATDPAQPYGAVLPWPAASSEERHRAARVAGAHVVLVGSEPVLYLERGGRSLGLLVGAQDPRVEPALAILAQQVRAGRLGRVALERVGSEPVLGSELEPLLVELGFRAGPRKLTLSA
jgi:ATP-dependent Lhr-like helicase